MSRIGKFIETERFVFFWGWDVVMRRNMVVMANASNIDYGDGCTTLKIYEVPLNCTH